MRRIFSILFTVIILLPINVLLSQDDKKDTMELKDINLSALSFRSIGPAITGGRIVALAVNPENTCEYYVGSGHGSLWKTSNCGTTFNPVFDGQSAYSIGAVSIDPTNPNVVWVGTGENNAQTNVIPGDGVYKSMDGGKTWSNKGLKESEHIGAIAVNPQNPDIVYVAAYGPHRRSGGDVGIFRTTDGGESWENVLFVSEHTGCWEVHLDPRDPNLIYAVAHQRQKNLYTGVYGGPESGIYKTEDGGDNWTKLKGGLPTENVGRIGMDISPVDPDVLFAVIDAKKGSDKGFYKSTDRGASWSKQSSYVTSYPFYMQKIFCDPENIDLIYAMDIFMQVSRDGGKSFSNLGTRYKHVDEHVLWIDPSNPSHLLSGCDGGLYESHDAGGSWAFHDNIPITEIYKVSTDNRKPFYSVYFGTQDNNSLGGPSQTINSSGIANRDWFFTWGGDGFETQVDWKNSDILYSQSQFGGLIRYNRKTGERLFIKPYEESDTAYRFDWDAALLLSQHDNHRLYFGGNLLLKSDDQGSNWRAISPDLTRGVPQKLMRIMDKSWSIDELSSKGSMAQILTIAESPIDENVLYTGSGDGLIYYTKNGGESWSKAKVKGLPEFANIRQIIASRHDVNTAYAACSNFLAGEYAPYLYKTTDGGANWTSINADLPENGCTYTIGEDHENPDLLFVGTQYGVFVSNTKEPKWVKLSLGIPNTMVMDLDLQRDEDDLVVSTFGRGVYILDDYSSLRNLDTKTIRSDATLFPVTDGRMYIEADPFGFPGVGFQGWNFYTAKNPPVGAAIDYYIKEKPESLKDKRRKAEKELQKEGKDIDYPDYSTRRAEADEMDPFLLFTIRDAAGNPIRKIKKPVAAGLNRLVWDFRYSPFTAVQLEPFDDSVPWNSPPQGYMAMPGKYSVEMGIFRNGAYEQLSSPQEFECAPLEIDGVELSDKAALDAFNKKVAELAIVLNGADAHRNHLSQRLPFLEKAIIEGANVDPGLLLKVKEVEQQIAELGRVINGDGLRASYEGATPMSVKGRIDLITGSLWSTTAAPTGTFKRAYSEAEAQVNEVLEGLKLINNKVQNLENELDNAGAPYTPGRLPAID